MASRDSALIEITSKSLLDTLDAFKGQSLVSLTEELFGRFYQNQRADFKDLGAEPKASSKTLKRRVEHFLGTPSHARIERLFARSPKPCLPIKKALRFAIENSLVSSHRLVQPGP